MLSKGAQKIASILRQHLLPYSCEYEFSDLRGKKGVPLRFDFAVFNHGKLLALVEYDGEMHFQRVNHYHKNQSDYLRAKERDRVKNKYCLMNNIPLYRIPYFEIDNINTLQDIFSAEHRVTTKYHNDYIKAP